MQPIEKRAIDFLKSKGIDNEKATKFLVEFAKSEIEIGKPKPKKFNFKQSLIELGFDKDLVSDWMEVRKRLKAVDTKTAFNGFVREVEKAELPKNQILEMCATNSWKGFKSKWIQDKTNDGRRIRETKGKFIF